MSRIERLNILAASDIHGIISVYNSLASRAMENDIDIVILAGDLTAYRERDIEDKIKKILISIKKPVLFVMGNMDQHEWKSEESLVNINEKRYILNGVPFAGYQYSNPFVGGVFEKDENGQAKDMERLSGLVDEDTVLVTHSPCFGKLDEPRKGLHAGSAALQRLCMGKQPKYHLFGHIHECSGAAGNHFNLSYPNWKSLFKLEYYSGEYEVIGIG